jgi:hypothetical protein
MGTPRGRYLVDDPNFILEQKAGGKREFAGGLLTFPGLRSHLSGLQGKLRGSRLCPAVPSAASSAWFRKAGLISKDIG